MPPQAPVANAPQETTSLDDLGVPAAEDLRRRNLIAHALYRDALCRAPTPAELGEMLRAFATGAPEIKIAQGLFSTKEHSRIELARVIRAIYGREPQAAELTTALDEVHAQGATLDAELASIACAPPALDRAATLAPNVPAAERAARNLVAAFELAVPPERLSKDTPPAAEDETARCLALSRGRAFSEARVERLFQMYTRSTPTAAERSMYADTYQDYRFFIIEAWLELDDRLSLIPETRAAAGEAPTRVSPCEARHRDQSVLHGSH